MAAGRAVMGSGIEALSERLRRVSANMQDLESLGREAQGIVIEGNAADRRAGKNRFGHKMPPIKPSTAKARERKGRGKGPYLAPGPGRDARESRSIANFFCRLEAHRGLSGFRITWGWRPIPWLRFFLARPQADVGGISPTTGKRISEAIRRHLGGVFER